MVEVFNRLPLGPKNTRRHAIGDQKTVNWSQLTLGRNRSEVWHGKCLQNLSERHGADCD